MTARWWCGSAGLLVHARRWRGSPVMRGNVVGGAVVVRWRGGSPVARWGRGRWCGGVVRGK